MKRNIFFELENAQAYNADFNTDFDGQDNISRIYLKKTAQSYNERFPKRKPLNAEGYFKQLKNQYKKIAGTTLPYKESKIVNERGDVILIHRDYGDAKTIFQNALIYIEDNYMNNSEQVGYWSTVIYIATGGYFVWETRGQYRGVESLLFGKKATEEKKARNYIKKSGETPEGFAHNLWEVWDGNTEDILNGVLEAILTIYKRQQAADMMIDLYIRDHQELEQNEAPF